MILRAYASGFINGRMAHLYRHLQSKHTQLLTKSCSHKQTPMKYQGIAFVVLLAALATVLPRLPQGATYTQHNSDILAAADLWLAAHDVSFAAAYDAASPRVHEAMTEAMWVQLFESQLGSLGPITERTRMQARFAPLPPTIRPLPSWLHTEGYAVVQFRSMFGDDAYAETLHLLRSEGTWGVISYTALMLPIDINLDD